MTDYTMIRNKFKKRSKKKGPVQARKISYDGINFASGLERYMYMALKKAKKHTVYEGQIHEIFSGLDFHY